MFDFLKRKPKADDEASALVEELAREDGRTYNFTLRNSTAGDKIQNAVPQLKRRAALAMLAWLNAHHSPAYNATEWRMRELFFDLLKRRIPFTSQDLVLILDWSARQQHNYYRGIPQMIKICGDYLKENPLTDDLRRSIDILVRAIGRGSQNSESRRWILRLMELMGDTDLQLPLAGQDVWAATAIDDIETLPDEKKVVWTELLILCLRATGSTPRAKWMKDTDRLVETIGREEFYAALLRWFPLTDRPRQDLQVQNDNVYAMIPVNADLLRGLVWLTARSGAHEMAGAVSALAISAYRKFAQPKVGNACFWVLGNMPGEEGVAQLSILKVRIKGNAAQKAIESALECAARRTGMTAAEVEEMSVPTYGLEEVGFTRFTCGDVVCELQVDGIEVEHTWQRAGKRLASTPKNVREGHPEELKEITQTVKDIRKMLPAQKDRIENLYLAQKKWAFSAWRDRYLNHPLVGTITRRLIWKFTRGDRAVSGIWLDGRMVGRDDEPLGWLDEETSVELWHPLHVDTAIVLEWREWLMRHEVRQPFKQAHREIYVLTDAERNTNTYSNRYAAHILRQHQFNALCAARGWKNALRLMVDAEIPPAMKFLPAYGLRAEYWVEGIGTNYGTDTNETGTYLYLTTDQVRFYLLEAAENRAHASGGGYGVMRRNGEGDAQPLPLEQIPPLVFSEIFRDVDLFVGVASVGNDPNWLDSGGEVRYRDYWHSFSFGDLGESAKTRKQLLEVLLPRLKIADQCRLADKFLVVRGELRTYKIHLGSSNILMEPNDQYLCIVPSRGMESGRDKLFLPFEGDTTLAVILSKAFMLADDKHIKDPTITRQIRQ